MRHRSLAGIARLAITLLACTAESAAAQGSVRVSRDLVSIAIPVGRDTRDEWRWNLPDTPTGQAEYVWSARLDGDSTHALGFKLFKFSGATPQAGDFAALLRAGQVNVVSIVGHRERALRGARVTMRGEDSTLVIELRDSTLIATMFGRKPREVAFQLMSPGQPFSTRRVVVRYEDH